MKIHTKITGIILSFVLGVMPFTAMEALAADDLTPPSSPTNLSASLNDSNQVDLSWDAASDDIGVTGYAVTRDNSIIAIAAETNHLDVNTTASTTYAYAVVAFDAAGNVSTMSTATSITTATSSVDTTIPSAPMDLMATVASSTQINLSWTASSDDVGVTGYNIYQDDAWIASTTATTHEVMNLTASTSYEFFVRAYDADANMSDQSNLVSVTTPASDDELDLIVPSAPTNLVGTAVSATQINLSWDASTDNVGVNGYNVYMNRNWVNHATSTSYNITGLTASTSYTFRLRAYDAAGNQSTWSDEITVSTLSDDTTPPTDDIDAIAPSIPSDLEITATSSDSVSLGWTASTDAVGVTGYSIYQDGFWIAMSPTNSFMVNGVNPDDGYTYFVRAFDMAGNVSGQSNHVATTDDAASFDNDEIAPSTPTNLAVSATSSDEVMLSWTASTDNVEVVGYNIYHDGDWAANIDYATSYNFSGLSEGMHNFYVRAYDMRGNMSAQSNVVSVDTSSSE